MSGIIVPFIMICKFVLSSICITAVFLAGGARSVFAAPIAQDLSAAVIYAYFGIVSDGNGTDPDNSLSLQVFQDGISEMTKGGYDIRALSEVLADQKNGKALSSRTIVLTFEVIDQTFLDEVLPVLEQNRIPFVAILSAAALDEAERSKKALGKKSYNAPDWSDIAELAQNPLVEIAMTPYAYRHAADEDGQAFAASINRAKARFHEKLGIEPRYFSYPYGEYAPDRLDILSKQGFDAALTQVSGVTAQDTPRLLLPRFTMTDRYADLDRLRMTSLALPLPVAEVDPKSVASATNPPHLSFAVSREIGEGDLRAMKCFASGVGDLETHRQGNRITIAPSRPFEDRSGRINCTIPVPSATDPDLVRWRWAGFQFSFPE